MRYWLLKGPPDGDKESWATADASTSWRFRRGPPDWALEDRLFLWERGRTRIVALAEVARAPGARAAEWGVRTLIGPLTCPVEAHHLREDVVLGDAAFLQRGPRQVISVTPEEARRLGRLISRRQSGADRVLERWLGPSVCRHKATVADDAGRIDGTKPVVLVAVGDPKLRLSLVAWAQAYWDDQVAVVEHADGLAAWSSALEHPPALVVVTEDLGPLSGRELTKRIRNDPRLTSTHLAVLATSDTPDREVREEWGADAVLRKPLRRIEVEARLGTLVEV